MSNNNWGNGSFRQIGSQQSHETFLQAFGPWDPPGPPPVQEDVYGLMKASCACRICGDIYVDAIVTSCAHTYCELCILMWLSYSAESKCLECGSPLSLSDIQRNETASGFVTMGHAQLSDEIRGARDELVAERREMTLEFDASLLREVHPNPNAVLRLIRRSLSPRFPGLPGTRLPMSPWEAGRVLAGYGEDHVQIELPNIRQSASLTTCQTVGCDDDQLFPTPPTLSGSAHAAPSVEEGFSHQMGGMTLRPPSPLQLMAAIDAQHLEKKHLGSGYDGADPPQEVVGPREQVARCSGRGRSHMVLRKREQQQHILNKGGKK